MIRAGPRSGPERTIKRSECPAPEGTNTKQPAFTILYLPENGAKPRGPILSRVRHPSHERDPDMTDDDKTENTPDRKIRRKRRPRWILMSIAGALVLAIAGTAVSTGGYSKWRGDGDRFDRFVEWKVEDMLDEVEATDGQREQVHAIVKAAVADLQGARDLKREIGRDLIAAFSKETIDRNELELLRQRKMEAVDSMSQRALTALADAAEVLTPAQRQELATEWESHMRHHHRHD